MRYDSVGSWLLVLVATLGAHGCSRRGSNQGPGAAPPTTGSIFGRVTFERWTSTATQGLNNGSAPTTLPLRFADVHLLDGGTSAVLQRTATDANGNYSFTAGIGSSFLVRVQTTTDQTAFLNFQVLTQAAGANYAIQSAPFTLTTTSLNTNLHQAAVTTGTPALVSGALNVFDSVVKTHELIRPTRADFDTLVGQAGSALQVYWAFGNSAPSSSFSRGTMTITIMGGTAGSESTTNTDMFDDFVTAHEATHYLQFVLSVNSSPGGSHATNPEFEVPALAYAEGLGTFVGAVVTGAATIVDTTGFGPGSPLPATFDAEANLVNGVTPPPGGNTGEFNAAVILWDLYDGAAGAVASVDADGLAVATTGLLTPAFNYNVTADWPALNTHLSRLVTAGLVTDAQLTTLMTAPHNHAFTWPPLVYPGLFPVQLAVNGATFSGNANGTGPIVGGTNTGGTNPFTIHHTFAVAAAAQHTITLTIAGAAPAAANNLDLALDRVGAGGTPTNVGGSSGLTGTETVVGTLQPGLHVVRVFAASTTASSGYTLRVTSP
ncbi:MAG: hypothetical protein HY722_16725 [Planctomycetes bacterium]|nr:hypothetical protein [Planctomycetota bacterium]